VARGIRVEGVISGESARVSWWHADACEEGLSWVWDGVRFDIVHPARGARFSGNDGSCVLPSEAGGERIMLSGDIEAPAEAVLLQARPRDLAARVLVAPHHGS